jgi:hypothetical protein
MLLTVWLWGDARACFDGFRRESFVVSFFWARVFFSLVGNMKEFCFGWVCLEILLKIFFS